MQHYRGGADRSLDRSTSQCRRRQSILSLEKGAFCVPNSKSILVTGPERLLGVTRDFNNIDTLAVTKFLFFSKVSFEGISRHSERS